MPKKAVYREPSRSSQICGYQLSINGWDSRESYCGEPKAKGKYWCDKHHAWVAADFEDGVIRMAPGNAIGK